MQRKLTEEATTAMARNFSLRSWICALTIVVVFAATQRTLFFLPAADIGENGPLVEIRSFLELAVIPQVMSVVLVELVQLIRAIVALARGKWMKAASLALATAAVPVLLLLQSYVPMFSPYFWYCVMNASSFEAIAKAQSGGRSPVVATLGSWDVSVGVAINPPLFATLVYDERGDAVASLLLSPNPPGHVSAFHYPPGIATTAVDHLFGDFYLAWGTYT